MTKHSTPSNYPRKRRHFPIVWRAAALLLIALTAAIAGAALITRATHTGTDCLLVNGDPETDLMDLGTGTHVPLPLWPQSKLPDFGSPHALSPDGLHEASFVDNTLVVNTFRATVPVGQHHYFESFDNYDTTRKEALWSPNSRWIASHWRTDNNEDYFAVADASGKQQKIVKLNLQPGHILQFDSWSADSTYLAVAELSPEISVDNIEHVITFWSMPDLQPIRSIDAQSGCYWSTVGHLVAYTTNDRISNVLHKSLVMSSPETSSQYIFSLREDSFQTLIWSPNGQYIAAASTADQPEGRIDIFGINGEIISNIGYTQERGVGCADCNLVANMIWTLDSDGLIFLRRSQYQTNKYDVMYYYLSSQAYTFLVTAEDRETSVFLSPNNRSAVLVSNQGNPPTVNLVSIDGLYMREVFLPLAVSINTPMSWSPNNLTFAISGVNSNGSAVYVFNEQGQLVHSYERYMNPDYNTPFAWTQCDPNA